MIHTAAIILVFLVIHFMDFYFKAKFGHAAGDDSGWGNTITILPLKLWINSKCCPL